MATTDGQRRYTVEVTTGPADNPVTQTVWTDNLSAKFKHQPDFRIDQLGVGLPVNAVPDEPVTLTLPCVCGSHVWTVEVPPGTWRRAP